MLRRRNRRGSSAPKRFACAAAVAAIDAMEEEGIIEHSLEIGEKVMVWKMGSTDRSIVVIDEEFLLRRDGKSSLRITCPNPKG